MKRWFASCVAGVVLLAAGCTVPDAFRLSFLQSGGADRDRVVAASVESVTFAAQTGLRGLGMKVEATPQGEGVRLVARGSSGEQLVLVLHRVKDEKGERTRVAFEAGTSEHAEIVARILTSAEGGQR
jgi:hypothetical protein